MGLFYYVLVGVAFCCFFFFKQKTAYELRISDWSSDVCSSDLRAAIFEHPLRRGHRRALLHQFRSLPRRHRHADQPAAGRIQIRALCRHRTGLLMAEETVILREKRPLWQKVALGVVGLVVALAVLAAGLLLFLDTQPGKKFLIRQIAALKLESGMAIEVGRIDEIGRAHV